MILNFQVLKDNADGTIDIEVPVYKKETITIPNGKSGNPLTGANLAYYLNQFVYSIQTEKSNIDYSAIDFTNKVGFTDPNFVNTIPDMSEISEAINTSFPMVYNG